MKYCDLILDNATIVTLDQDDRILTQHALIINENKIIDIIESTQAQKSYQAKEVYNLKKKFFYLVLSICTPISLCLISKA